MMLDLPTVIVATCSTVIMQGVLLLYFWFRDKRPLALALCGSGFIAFGAGFALLGGVNFLPSFVASGLGGACAVLAGALFVNTARQLEHRRTPAALVIAPPLVWLLAWAFLPAMASPGFRETSLSAFMSLCYALCALEGWRGRAGGLALRWPLIAVAIAFFIMFAARTFYSDDMPFPLGAHLSGNNIWFSVASLAVFGLLSLVAFLVVGVTYDRLEADRPQPVFVDPVTGMLRREAFTLQAARLATRHHLEGRSACLALITISAPPGRAGDIAVRTFARLASGGDRAADLLARMSAHEFACMYSDMAIGEATECARSLVSQLEQAAMEHGVPIRVCAGLASTTQVGNDLRQLVHVAHQALRHAKTAGTDVVAYHPGLERNVST